MLSVGGDDAGSAGASASGSGGSSGGGGGGNGGGGLVAQITAHRQRIYGLDWSHRSASELLTCSQDSSVKFWDVSGARAVCLVGGLDLARPALG